MDSFVNYLWCVKGITMLDKTLGGFFMNIKKKLASISVVAMMMSTMVINASAFQATKYVRANHGSDANAWVSCVMTGSYGGSTVSGLGWTKTSSNSNNVFNPNCYYTGYSYVSASIGGVPCGSNTNYAGEASKNFSLGGCTTSKTVQTIHIYNSSLYGDCNTMLSDNTY